MDVVRPLTEQGLRKEARVSGECEKIRETVVDAYIRIG